MKRRALILSVFVALLVGGFGLSVWRAKQQYALNRELIAALAHNAPQEQLRLVALGADPNTPLDALPKPTFTLLARQWLHLTPPPINDSPTALMLACGFWYDDRTQRNVAAFEQPETLTLIQAMLAHGARVRARSKFGETALHYAIRRRRAQTAALLLQHGARINVRDYGGTTPLIEATNTSIDVVHWLLTAGADPNVQDEAGGTALYYTVMCSNAGAGGNAYQRTFFLTRSTGMIGELLAHGANPNLPNRNGISALKLAQNRHDTALVSLLQKGAK